MGAQPHRSDEARAGRVIGVVSPLVGGFYFGSLVAGVTRAAARAGMRVVAVQTFPGRLAREKHRSTALPGDRGGLGVMAGVVVVTEALDRDRLERLAAERPVVLIGTDDAPAGVPVLRPDNVGGARAAVEHLLRHGHTRIGFAGDLAQGDVRERFEAYRATLRGHGIDPDESWFVHAPGNSVQGGAEAADALNEAGRPTTATLAATDLAALGLVRGLQAAGAALPRDHAVIGFDRTVGGGRQVPRLSTVDPHHDRVGELAVAHLLVRLRGGADRPEPPTRVPATLVTRESCGCDRVGTRRADSCAVGGGEQAGPATGADAADDDAARPDAAAHPDTAPHPDDDAPRPDDATQQPATTPGRAQLAHVAEHGLAGSVRVRSRRGEPRGSTAPADPRDAWYATVLGALDAAATRAVVPTVAALRRLQDLTTTLGPYPETLEQCVTAIRQVEHELAATLPDDTRRAALQRTTTELLLALTRGCMRPQLMREALLERAMADQYEVDMDVATLRGMDPRSLTWLPGGGRTSACLGLWTGAESATGERELEVVGAQARSGALARTVGRRMSADQFPPTALLRGEPPDGQTLVLVVPVASAVHDWGLLAVAGRADTRGTYSRDRHQHWAALLAAALDREQALGRLRDQLAAIERAAVDAGAVSESLKRQDQRRELWLRAMGHGLWDWDVASGSVQWSAQWASLVGVAPEALGDQPSEWLDRVHPDDRVTVSSLVAAQLGGRPARCGSSTGCATPPAATAGCCARSSPSRARRASRRA